MVQTIFVGKDLFRLGVYDVAANYNMGAESVKEVSRKLWINNSVPLDIAMPRK